MNNKKRNIDVSLFCANCYIITKKFLEGREFIDKVEIKEVEIKVKN